MVGPAPGKLNAALPRPAAPATGPSGAPDGRIEAMCSLQGRPLAQEPAGRRGGAAFDHIDLFAGIGGLRAGFDALGGRCVWAAERDPFARATYEANHPGPHRWAHDVAAVPEEEVPAHDVLLAGFPCQPFSTAGVSKANSMGRRHGFLDASRGTLFFDVARIIAHRRPALFVLENVRNLRAHDGGRTFRVIYQTLAEDLGYQVNVHLINARHWVPQSRERLFIVGAREGAAFRFDDLFVPPLSGPQPTLGAVLNPQDGSEAAEPPYTEGPDAAVAARYTLRPATWKALRGHAERHAEQGNGFGFGLVGPADVARTLSARYHKDGAEILVRQEGRPPRRLTPRECARLQGFDRPGAPRFRIPVSDTQAYQQFGNAVAPPVSIALARHLAGRFPEVLAPRPARLEAPMAVEASP